MKRVVIVGGGVIGVACAHWLHEAGCVVTILDKGQLGHGCSRGNCGYVCPSHILPLAGPGVIGPTLKTMFRRNSPFKIRWRFDPSLWWWLWKFATRCNGRDMIATGHALQALLESSRTLYGDLFRTGTLEAEWEERGLLFVFRTPAAMDHYAHTDHLLRTTYQMGAVRLDGAALTDREPALKPGLAGGWHYERDAHLRSDRLMASWADRLRRSGIDVRENCEFLGFAESGRVVREVKTSQGSIAAEEVVIATGAWTPLLSGPLGCRVPIQPGKGYSITMARPNRCPTIPLIFEEERVAVTPMRSAYRIGSTMEFAGYDATMRRERLDLLRQGVRPYLHEPEADPVEEEWWGWRPMVYDGLPIIGRSPKRDNVMIAAGHGMLGLSLATGTAKLVSELLTGVEPHVDPRPYAATRF